MACEWRQMGRRRAATPVSPPDGPYTIHEIPLWSDTTKPEFPRPVLFQPWKDGNNQFSLWYGAAEQVQSDFFIIWVPPRGTGTMAVHLQETEALWFTMGGASAQPGAMAVGRPVNAAATMIAAMVGPVDPDPQVLAQMTKTFLDNVTARAKGIGMDIACFSYDSLRIWENDEDTMAIPILVAIREWMQDNPGALTRLIVGHTGR